MNYIIEAIKQVERQDRELAEARKKDFPFM